MKRTLREKIDEAISFAERAITRAGAYPHLPAIIELLRRMQAGVDKEAEERKKTVGAFGKLVMDDFSFSESKLGGVLLEVGNEYSSSEDI